jgi:hypothetical protein
MTKLYELAKLVRSKNAGPFELTIDIMFEDEETYERVISSGKINEELFESLFRTPAKDVRLIPYPAAYSIKATIPRPNVSGDLEDGDTLGGQLYGPLVDVEID